MTKFHKTLEELQTGLPDICQSPLDVGAVRAIVRRPRPGERESLAAGELSPDAGLVGDGWLARARKLNPDTQLTIMNSRAVALIAGTSKRWPLAGDQLFVDLDLSESNLPVGTRLGIGTALVEVTAVPHTGCKRFSGRFGVAALEFVNSATGRQLNLRGIYVRILTAGTVRVGDPVHKIPAER